MKGSVSRGYGAKDMVRRLGIERTVGAISAANFNGADLSQLQPAVAVGYSNSNVPTVKPTQDWQGEHPPSPLDATRNWCVFFQRYIRATSL
jgi:hypothetical protein